MERGDHLAEIYNIVEEIEGVILLDLKGIDGTWREHVDKIYEKLQRIRAICGDEAD